MRSVPQVRLVVHVVDERGEVEGGHSEKYVGLVESSLSVGDGGGGKTTMRKDACRARSLATDAPGGGRASGWVRPNRRHMTAAGRNRRNIVNIWLNRVLN